MAADPPQERSYGHRGKFLRKPASLGGGRDTHQMMDACFEAGENSATTGPTDTGVGLGVYDLEPRRSSPYQDLPAEVPRWR